MDERRKNDEVLVAGMARIEERLTATHDIVLDNRDEFRSYKKDTDKRLVSMDKKLWGHSLSLTAIMAAIGAYLKSTFLS